MNAFLHSLNVRELKVWFDENLNLDTRQDCAIFDIYQKYEQDRYKINSIAVKPKVFSKELKIHYFSEIEANKVRIYYRRAPMVTGLEIKQT